jgi:hypothetical protein
MNDSTVGNASALYFTLNDANGTEHEYGGLSTIIRSNTNGGESGDLFFMTSDNGTTRSEKMRIQYNGNVGIGTSDPTSKLHIKGANAKIRLTGDTYTSVEIEDGGTGDPGYIRTYTYGTANMQLGDGGTYFNVGNIGIGTTSPNSLLDVRGKVNVVQGGRTLSLGDGNYANHILCDSNVDFAFNYNNSSTGGLGFFGGTSSAKFMCSYTGTLTVAGDVIAYGTPSDARLKDIKEKVPNALESVLKLNGYKFDWKERESNIYGDDKTILHIKEDIGVIAQEVEALFPELARTNDDGYMSVRYQGLTAVLIEAIKEQQQQIDELKYLLQTINK